MTLEPRYTAGGNLYFHEAGQYDQSEYWRHVAMNRDVLDQRLINEVSPDRGELPADTNIDQLRNRDDAGTWRVVTGARAQEVGLPETMQGTFTVEWVTGNTNGLTLQTFTTRSGKTWRRSINAGTSAQWTSWERETFIRGTLAEDADLNTYLTPGIYRANAAVLRTVANFPPTSVSAPVGFLTVTNVEDAPNNWAGQSYQIHGSQPEYWWRMTDSTAPTWNDWVRLYPAPDNGGDVDYFTAPTPSDSHEMRVRSFKDAYPLVSTEGKGAVVFRYDHGLTNFKNVLLPLHQQYNIKAYIAMNSRLWDETENNGATQAEASQWRASGLVEFGNHTADHLNKDTAEGIYDNIVNGRKELESQVGGTIWGYTVPGLTGTQFQGFGAGYFNAFSDTYAGGLILANHAITSGVVTQPAGGVFRTLDGNIRQGGRHYTWEAAAWEDIKAQIDQAAATKTALTIMCHPRTMRSTSGGRTYWTPELAEQVISYIRQLIDEGLLADISYYQSHHAQLEPLPTPTYQSGLRDISSELMNGWTGTLFVEREGKNVYFRGQLSAAEATSDIAWMLPAGFGPGFIQSGSGSIDYGSGITWSQNNPPRIYRINHYLRRFEMVGSSGDTSPISVNHSIRTPDSAPSSAPGVPAA